MGRVVKSIVRSIKPRKWFPPDDPIASAVARLCILREDFYLEGIALGSKELAVLDQNGFAWRQMYFLRQLMKTMTEARSALMILEQCPRFQVALGEAGNGFREEVKEFLRIVNSKDLKNIRNNIGAHVKPTAVESVLKE
jgi:hypothetical protein